MSATNWVLDCSLAMAWSLPDERSDLADRFWSEVTDDFNVWVPALWWYEISNALAAAHRRGRISRATMSRLTDLFGRLPVRTDAGVGGSAFRQTGSLATEYGLSSYDAAYLELACRRGLALATLDEQLSAVAREAGVGVWR